jgi:hypothetical protein
MATKFAPHSYHWCQVALHWLVAALVATQYATGGSIGRTHSAVAHGGKAEPLDLLLHAIHNRVGLLNRLRGSRPPVSIEGADWNNLGYPLGTNEICPG